MRYLPVLSMLLAGAFGVTFLSGCKRPDRTEPVDYAPPRPGPVQPGPEEAPGPPPNPPPQRPQDDPHVVKPAREPLRGRLSDNEKQDVVYRALLELQRMVVCGDERLDLSRGSEDVTVACELAKTKLAELGYRVTETTARLSYEASAHQLDSFRVQHDCNLAFLFEGVATEADKFGNFWSYKSDLKGKVVNLTTHQDIATKTSRKLGRRALDEREAAVDALESAALDLVTYLTDEVSRKWEAMSLIKKRLICTDLDHLQEADDLRIGLQRRSGIYYVSLEEWDQEEEIAVFEILCRFDVEQHLPGYIDELREGRIQVQSITRIGNEIRADQDWRD